MPQDVPVILLFAVARGRDYYTRAQKSPGRFRSRARVESLSAGLVLGNRVNHLVVLEVDDEILILPASNRRISDRRTHRGWTTVF